jgi:hypothetical protein
MVQDRIRSQLWVQIHPGIGSGNNNPDKTRPDILLTQPAQNVFVKKLFLKEKYFPFGTSLTMGR